MSEPAPVVVVGAGLAGCEAAVQLARRGLPVRLLEMKPRVYSPAHSLPGPAELVCSNSLKSDSEDTAHGLLKREIRGLGSVILEAADRTRVPAGTALAVDRKKFTEAMTAILGRFENIVFKQNTEVGTIPEGEVILATGPLTSKELARSLQHRLESDEDLFFYDALAPIIDAESIDNATVFRASRWGRGADYLNCPFTKDEYQAFIKVLRSAPRTEFREFETERYFEGCLPIEVLAERGDDTLAFGPMRPVGLVHEGKRPYAVVQLRSENRINSAYNLVGFQTKLTHAGQREVFRQIPGLRRAEFLRYGAVHRNMYINSPVELTDTLGLRTDPRVRLAGQIVGVEGYVESAAVGLLVGLMTAAVKLGEPVEPPPEETCLGALYKHVRGGFGKKQFEPMNINFGLLPDTGLRGRIKRRKAAGERAEQALEEWMQRLGVMRNDVGADT
jgi:methylenetetrahydrofolate--tRNA-(uracil-5-)-methyltransferase